VLPCLCACRKPNDYLNNPDRKITTRFLGSLGMQTRRLSRKLSECLCSFTALHLITLDSRKAAMTAHPDKGRSEAKMAQVNEAYEVLSNPGEQLCTISTFVLLAQVIFTELRQQFDNGDHPNDPGSQGGAPFTGYGSPFGGGFGGDGDHPFAQFFQQAEQRGFSFGRGLLTT
jgi:hypothetical protein